MPLKLLRISLIFTIREIRVLYGRKGPNGRIWHIAYFLSREYLSLNPPLLFAALLLPASFLSHLGISLNNFYTHHKHAAHNLAPT